MRVMCSMLGQIGLFLALVVVPSFAGPQPVGPIAGKPIQSKFAPADQTRLLRLYATNQWGAVAALGESILTQTAERPAWELRRDYVSLVVVGPGTNGDPQIIRILVHHGATLPYSTSLPGLRPFTPARFYEVLLAHSQSATLNSTYSFEPTNDGLQDRLAGFLKSSVDLGALARQLPPSRGGTQEFAWPADAELWLIPNVVPMPMQNAKITIHSDVVLPVTRATFGPSASSLCRKAANRVAATSVAPCAHEFAEQFDDVVFTCLDCSSPKTVAAAIDGVLAKAADACKAITPADWAIAVSLADQLETLAKPTAVKGDFTLTNHSIQRFGLSVGAAIIITGGGRRAKIDSGKVVRDPTRGPATSAMVDYYPLADSPESDTGKNPARLRLSGGVLVSPDPGVTVQLGLMPLPIKGATVNYGLGIAWQRTLRNGYGFGSPEVTALSDPSSALYIRGTAIQTLGLSFTY